MKIRHALLGLNTSLAALMFPSILSAQLRDATWRGGPTLAFSAESLQVTWPEHQVAQRYAYHEKGDTLTLAGYGEPGRPCAASGLYQTHYHRGGQRLVLYALKDPCAARTGLLTSTSSYDFIAPEFGAPRDWFARGPEDSVAGIDLYRARNLLRHRRASPVIVAVIDNGVDLNHPDLAGAIWTNPGEVPDNGIDDDHNGYVDDVHGWNFRGRSDGSVVQDEQASATQLVARWSDRFARADTTSMSPADRADWDQYRRALRDYQANVGPGSDSSGWRVLYNLTPVSSSLIGDDPGNLRETGYGSPRFRLSPNLTHGTHVAGIIAARRNNELGPDGIADSVRIMPLLATTAGGDERDKDVANAIRYAVDNGARVINLSFSKLYSPDKDVVDQAISYAERAHVLIVHAAGNDGNNNDSIPHYPTAIDRTGRRATNLITVGWNRSRFTNRLAHPLSDYSRTSVDLFAPGSDIFSLLPEDGYGLKSGSSMSAPMVTGVIGLLYSYFPTLTSDQVKSIILDSAYRPDQTVDQPGTRRTVPFSTLSVTGGILNAYQAVQRAIELTSAH